MVVSNAPASIARRAGSLWCAAFSLMVVPGCAALPRATLPPTPDDDGVVRLERNRRALFEGNLEAEIRSAPASRVTVLLDLTDQIDLDRLARSLSRPPLRSKAARRDAVVAALERTASRQQARIRPAIDRLVAGGDLDEVRSVAIVNRLIVSGTGAAVLALAASPEVARVRREWSARIEIGAGVPDESESEPLAEAFTSWAIRAVGADVLWREGLSGRGVVVASIDTGVFEAHEQLRGRRLEGDRGWYDAVAGSAAPSDAHGHGTSVMSVAVGSNREGRVVGVAPGASWTVALGNPGNHYTRSRMTLAADWILRTARPDVLVNAWSHGGGACNDFDLPFIRAWQAAGIFVVFPSGNGGPGRSTGESPAQLTGAFPGNAPVFSVAALASTGGVHPSSSRGPSRCGSSAFPSVAAPGGRIPHALPPNPRGYAYGEGTSLAAGIVAGGAAVLLEAVPEASPEEIERALIASARPLGAAGRDDGAGAGCIDLPAALELLRESVGLGGRLPLEHRVDERRQDRLADENHEQAQQKKDHHDRQHPDLSPRPKKREELPDDPPVSHRDPQKDDL